MSNLYYYTEDYQLLLTKIILSYDNDKARIINSDEFGKLLFENMKAHTMFDFFNELKTEKMLIITNAEELKGKYTTQILLKEALEARISDDDSKSTYIFSLVHPNYIDNIALKEFILNNFKPIYLIDEAKFKEEE